MKIVKIPSSGRKQLHRNCILYFLEHKHIYNKTKVKTASRNRPLLALKYLLCSVCQGVLSVFHAHAGQVCCRSLWPLSLSGLFRSSYYFLCGLIHQLNICFLCFQVRCYCLAFPSLIPSLHCQELQNTHLINVTHVQLTLRILR